MVGAKTVNSVNVYPDLDKWHVIDPNGQYEEVYNRYAHILVDFQNFLFKTFFESFMILKFKMEWVLR